MKILYLRILSGLFALLLLMTGCAAPPVQRQNDIGSAATAIWTLEQYGTESVGFSEVEEFITLEVMSVWQDHGLNVVDRAKLDLVLTELKLGEGKLVDPATRLRLGKISGAAFMVFGGYQEIAGRVRMDLRLVDVASGQILQAAEKISPSSGIDGLAELAREVAGELIAKSL